MKYYDIPIDKVLEDLESSMSGISSEEAKSRLNRDGKNQLLEKKKESHFQKFLHEFQDIMIIILILSAIISFIFSLINHESFMDSIIILMIVLLNAILGFVQELKADKSIESLKRMQVTKVKVKREDKVFVIPSEEVVRGDLLLLEAGDQVPADARIVQESSLQVDESSLTGESMAVAKIVDVVSSDAPLASRSNMVFSGTSVVYGKCQAVVCEVGMGTEFGKIAESLNEEVHEVTPLQRKLNDISKFLSIVIGVIIVLMFCLGLLKRMNLADIIMLSISLAVAAIPEGLPAVITITLSLGMNAMALKKAIVRKMSSVETLGCTEIICSDKTGTITQNKMMVREVFYDNQICHVNDLDSDNILFQIMALNNDVFKNGKDYVGDPTEIALYECLEHVLDIEKLRKEMKRVYELPFDSERKMMSTIHECGKELFLYTKGSFDSLIECCSYVLENGMIVKLTKAKKAHLKEIEMQESNKAYRVLSYAYKKVARDFSRNENLESEMIFVGMTSMMDPPREDVKESIELCKQAHIRPIMITGDSLSTAISIARDVGILEDEKEAITGAEIDQMSPQKLSKNISKYSVYARVSPLNKFSIVKAWQNQGKIVAMTGDGVNDAPALKAADIGVGMGITGTEVSKGISDIILADDSFSTIVLAVREGRRIFDNIRNVLVYLLTGNIAEVAVVFVGMLFGIEIFLPIQLLYINLITDSIPAIALAFEKSADDVMSRKVRKSSDSFFTPFLMAKMGLSSLLKSMAILLVYFLNLKVSGTEVAITMAFLVLILSEMIFAFSCKNLKNSVLGKGMLHNRFMNYSMLVLGMIQILIFVTPIRGIFHIVSLSGMQIAYCFLIVLLVFFIDEFSKKLIAIIFKD